jgi:hypothetical protein
MVENYTKPDHLIKNIFFLAFYMYNALASGTLKNWIGPPFFLLIEWLALAEMNHLNTRNVRFLDLHCLDEIRNHVFKKVFCPDFK